MPKTTYPAIKARFFQAFDDLMLTGKIDNEFSFCVGHKINRRNFSQRRVLANRDPSLGWMAILVSEFKVSGDWMLTGMGKMYRA